jgi:hypothetical protein
MRLHPMLVELAPYAGICAWGSAEDAAFGEAAAAGAGTVVVVVVVGVEVVPDFPGVVTPPPLPVLDVPTGVVGVVTGSDGRVGRGKPRGLVALDTVPVMVGSTDPSPVEPNVPVRPERIRVSRLVVPLGDVVSAVRESFEPDEEPPQRSTSPTTGDDEVGLLLGEADDEGADRCTRSGQADA